MRSRITSVQLAVLELQQGEAKKALAQLDAITARAHELLEIDPERDGRAADWIADFLNGHIDSATLLENLNAQRNPRYRPAGTAIATSKPVRIYGRDVEVIQ